MVLPSWNTCINRFLPRIGSNDVPVLRLSLVCTFTLALSVPIIFTPILGVVVFSLSLASRSISEHTFVFLVFACIFL